MRNHYFALDTRPVCPKCRMGYDKRIQYGRGPGSLVRILTWGGGAALAGALLLGIVGFWMGTSAAMETLNHTSATAAIWLRRM